MNNNTKRALACVLFGLAALGSFTTSYLHVAAYFAPVMPAAWAEGAYVAALALDMLAVACGAGLLLTDSKAPGRAWLHVGLWTPVVLSVWANWRYAAEHVGAGAWRFDPMVSACLPVLLVIATHGLAAVLRAIPADVEPAAGNAPAWEPVAASEPRKAASAPKPHAAAKQAPRKATAAQATDWHDAALALLADGLKGAEVARRVGVDASQVSRLKARAAVNGNGQAVAS